MPQGDMAAHVLGGIVNNPQFAQIRQLIRNDPSALGPILIGDGIVRSFAGVAMIGTAFFIIHPFQNNQSNEDT